MEQALEITGQAGILLRPPLVSFTPWTTLDDDIDVIDFVEELGPTDHVDPVQYSIRLLVPPGSSLLNSASLKPFLGNLNQETFSYEWKHPDPRLDILQEGVASITEAAAQTNEDPAATFDKIKSLSFSLDRHRRLSPAQAPRDLHRGSSAPAHRIVVLLRGTYARPVDPGDRRSFSGLGRFVGFFQERVGGRFLATVEPLQRQNLELLVITPWLRRTQIELGLHRVLLVRGVRRGD